MWNPRFLKVPMYYGPKLSRHLETLRQMTCLTRPKTAKSHGKTIHSFGNSVLWNGLAHNLSRIPASTKGYVLGARTAARFKPVSKDVTPYPGMYQKVSTYNEKYKQSFAPFNVMMPRFTTEIKGASYPGPGTYNPEKKLPPKIVWPMKFGSPDWCQVPCLEKRTLKAELSTDKDFRKHRNRVAYFSLFYN
uniref:protein pitchfork isoform X3 n=1 Tax=Myodes glareolus TaxID=447135 RepID=UPI00202087EC|nr:protein pitchfork isoform X3 [Myodes glareolus]